MELRFKELIHTIDQALNKNDLLAWLKKIKITDFVLKEEKLLRKHKVSPAIMSEARILKGTKDKLCSVCTIIWWNSEIWEAFRKFLIPEVKQIFDYLLINKVATMDQIEKELGIELINDKFRSDSFRHYDWERIIKKEFSIFVKRAMRWGENPSIRILPGIRKNIVAVSKAPDWAVIKPVKQPEPTEFVYDRGEADILMEFSRLDAYAKNGLIKVSAKGKVTYTSMGKIKRTLGLAEFFPDTEAKQLKHLRTCLLAGVFGNLGKLKSSMQNHEQIYYIFNNYYQDAYSSYYGIVHYLKGGNHVESYYLNDDLETEYLKEFANLKEGEWYSVQKVFMSFQYRGVDFMPLTQYNNLYNKGHYVLHPDYVSGWNDRYTISEGNFYETIVRPIFKGTLFLFAAFGLLDIAYDEVPMKSLGAVDFSPYDHLKYFRITPLGAYVFGHTKVYTPPVSDNSDMMELSEDSLTIIVSNGNKTAEILLNAYMNKISANRYQTDHHLFLSGCRTKKQIKEKIDIFKEIVSQELPSNWEAFFKDLYSKIDPLQKVTNYVVYQIPKENKPLRELIARDHILKSITLKGEDFHILIDKANFPKFKKRLATFGFLII